MTAKGFSRCVALLWIAFLPCAGTSFADDVSTSQPDSRGTQDKGGGFEIYDNYDLRGSGQNHQAYATTVDDCRDECQKDQGCKSFAFDKWKAACYLESSVGNFRFEPRFASGLAPGVPPTEQSEQAILTECISDHSFKGAEHQHDEGGTLEACDKKCADDVACVAFDYDPAKKSCQSYTSVFALDGRNNYVAGVKHQLISDKNASMVRKCVAGNNGAPISMFSAQNVFALHQACVIREFEGRLGAAKEVDPELIPKTMSSCEAVLKSLKDAILKQTKDEKFAEELLGKVRMSSKRTLSIVLFRFMAEK